MERKYTVRISNNKRLTTNEIELYQSQGFIINTESRCTRYTKLQMTMNEITNFIAFFSDMYYTGCTVTVCQNKLKFENKSVDQVEEEKEEEVVEENAKCQCKCKNTILGTPCTSTWFIEVNDGPPRDW